MARFLHFSLAARTPLMLAALLQACAAADDTSPSGQPGTAGTSTGAAGAAGGGPGGNTTLPSGQGGGAGNISDPSVIAPSPGGAGTGLPCAVQKVVHDKCQACHADPPKGTFMALTTHAQFHAQGTSDKSKQYWELAKVRVNAASNAMPPATASALSADEKATLNAWLDQGAPASDEICEAAEGPGGDGAVSAEDVDTTGLECYKFLAHAPGDKNAKFKVGSAVDAYYNFGFKAPWPATAYGLVIKPVIDNATVLHHWLLYREDAQDGSVEVSGGQHTGGELVHGWAPGGVAMDFRPHGDVSFELPASSYVVEFHYNSSDPNALDASGVEVCLQREPTKNIAGISWVGYDQGIEAYAAGALLGTGFSELCLSPADEWVGTCEPLSSEPIHILYVTPHMHQAGVHMKSIINGPSGSRTLHDEAFDFNYQTSYPKNEVLMPGETITTTCNFSSPKCAGQATGTEMCYLFTYAYPKGALRDNGSWGQLAHGEGACLGQ